MKKGLKYRIKNKKIDSYEILARFEQLAQYLNKLEAKPNQDSRTTQLDNKNSFFQHLQKMALEFVELTKEARDNMSDDEQVVNSNKTKQSKVKQSYKITYITYMDTLISKFKKKTLISHTIV